MNRVNLVKAIHEQEYNTKLAIKLIEKEKDNIFLSNFKIFLTVVKHNENKIDFSIVNYYGDKQYTVMEEKNTTIEKTIEYLLYGGYIHE